MNVYETHDYISSLKLFIQNEFRTEMLDKCGVSAGDCLVCQNTPSESCLVCSTKVFQTESRKRRSSSVAARRPSSSNLLNTSTIAGGSYSSTNFKKTQAAPTIHQQPRDQSRFRNSALRVSRDSNTSTSGYPDQRRSGAAATPLNSSSSTAAAGGVTAGRPNTATTSTAAASAFDDGDPKRKQLQVVSDYTVFLKRQLENNERDRQHLEAVMNDCNTKNIVLAEENKMLWEKLNASRGEVMQKDAAIKDLRDQIEGYAANIVELKKMVSLSEACRSNTARALAKWRKEKGFVHRKQDDPDFQQEYDN